MHVTVLSHLHMQFVLLVYNSYYASYVPKLCNYKIKSSITSTKCLQFPYKRRNKDVKRRLVSTRNKSQYTNSLTHLDFCRYLGQERLKGGKL